MPARSMASRRLGASLAFEMPTLDPRLAGLTNIGKLSAALEVGGDCVALAFPVAPQDDS